MRQLLGITVQDRPARVYRALCLTASLNLALLYRIRDCHAERVICVSCEFQAVAISLGCHLGQPPLQYVNLKRSCLRITFVILRYLEHSVKLAVKPDIPCAQVLRGKRGVIYRPIPYSAFTWHVIGLADLTQGFTFSEAETDFGGDFD